MRLQPECHHRYRKSRNRKEYNPNAKNQYIQKPKRAYIDEGNYFTHNILDDMYVTAKDIHFEYTKYSL